MRLITLLLFSIFTSTSLFAQQTPDFWSDIKENTIQLNSNAQRSAIPHNLRALQLDLAAFSSYLATAPMERTAEAQNNPLLVSLPMPDGSNEVFELTEAPVMESGLAAKYPQMNSYVGRGVEHPSQHLRLSNTQLGVTAVIKTQQGRVIIEPYTERQNSIYQSYYFQDQEIDQTFECGSGTAEISSFAPLTESMLHEHSHSGDSRGGSSVAVDLKTYRLALGCTSAWGSTQGSGTVEDALAEMVSLMVVINSILESEVAIRLVLINNTDLLLQVDPATEIYSNLSNSGGLLGQYQIVCDNIIGSSGYDLGHMFTANCVGNGGIARLASVCDPEAKAMGVSCFFSSNNVSWVSGTTVHELGHQFSTGHTMNSCDGNEGNLSPSFAYEPGGGSTIMAYATGCGSQGFAPSGEYYHVGSLEAMFQYSRSSQGSNCGTSMIVNNEKPEVSIPLEDDFYIPISTPFELTGEASDANGDEMLYTWEQFNLGPQVVMAAPQGSCPLFRSYPPNSDKTRYFPRIVSILFNTSQLQETLPTYSRNLKFRFTARDNNPEGGGVAWTEVDFQATETAGPFLVTYPNTSDVVWEVGQEVEVTWDVANTDNNLVNCQSVDIYISNGGDFENAILVADNTPNIGSATISVPNFISSSARVRVIASENIFFDVSDKNFSIVDASTPTYTLDASPLVQQVCPPAPAVVELNTGSILGYTDPITFSLASTLPDGATASFSSTTINPTENSTLSIDMTDVEEGGTYEIIIQADSDGAGTTQRVLTLSLVPNDFSDLILQEPADGTSGLFGLPTFNWDMAEDANTYIIEIADNPAFDESDLLVSENTINTTAYTVEDPLELGKVFYWRVVPVNECGFGQPTAPYAFSTASFDCAPFVNDNSTFITGQGLPTVESSIIINSGGTISDINIPNINLNHDLIKHLDVSLVSPQGTEVELFSDLCGNNTILNIGLDDQAGLTIPCPPTGGTFQPQNSLSAFNGENSTGEWILRMVVNDPLGSGGDLLGWSLEMCGGISLSPPFVILNEPMPVAPGDDRDITSEFLEAGDNNNTPGQIRFTLVTLPQYGTLMSDGEIVEVGDEWRQSTINAHNLTYIHDGSAVASDHFKFTLSDGEGGFFGTPQFDIVIDENVSASDIEDIQKIVFHPNPAKDRLNITFLQLVEGALDINVFNLQGQLLMNPTVSNPHRNLSLDTSSIPSGIYLIRIQMGKAVITERIVIQK